LLVNLIANIVTFLLLSLMTGLGSAWMMINSGSTLTSATEGPWQAWTRVGKSTADPYTRAHITRSGRLPVMSKSLLYFRTVHDSDDRKIDAECDYEITGFDPGGNWWSLAAYDGGGNLMTNPAARYAFNASNVLRDPTGKFTITLSKFPAPRNWLPVDSDYQVQLVLRLHQRIPDARSDGGLIGLPEIRRTRCH